MSLFLLLIITSSIPVIALETDAGWISLFDGKTLNGWKAGGYDIDPQRVKESLQNVRKNNVGDLVTIEQKDIFTLDLSKTSVTTLYLLPSLNVKLIPQLQKLKPGSRIVLHDFQM
jgi:ribosomal protein L11 methylase PrmA